MQSCRSRRRFASPRLRPPGESSAPTEGACRPRCPRERDRCAPRPPAPGEPSCSVGVAACRAATPPLPRTPVDSGVGDRECNAGGALLSLLCRSLLRGGSRTSEGGECCSVFQVAPSTASATPPGMISWRTRVTHGRGETGTASLRWPSLCCDSLRTCCQSGRVPAPVLDAAEAHDVGGVLSACAAWPWKRIVWTSRKTA